MDAPTRHAIERLSRDRLTNLHERYTSNCTYGLVSTAHENAVRRPNCVFRLLCVGTQALVSKGSGRPPRANAGND